MTAPAGGAGTLGTTSWSGGRRASAGGRRAGRFGQRVAVAVAVGRVVGHRQVVVSAGQRVHRGAVAERWGQRV